MSQESRVGYKENETEGRKLLQDLLVRGHHCGQQGQDCPDLRRHPECISEGERLWVVDA